MNKEAFLNSEIYVGMEVDSMLKAVDVAEYFLNKDDGKLFVNELLHREGRSFYEGNARLNKYLHIAQNLYIAKTGGKLFDDALYAYDNGAVVPAVQENYMILYKKEHNVSFPADICEFLDKVYIALENATLEELIEISHEDVEWAKKHRYYRKEEQRMDSMDHVDEYKKQYADMLKVMERM